MNKRIIRYNCFFLLIIFITLLLTQQAISTIVTIYAINDTNHTSGFIYYDSVAKSVNMGGSQTRVGANTLAGPDYWRSFFDFNTSVIPIGATIHNVTLNLTIAGTNNNAGLNITSLTVRAKSRIIDNNLNALFNECDGTGSTKYITSTTVWDSVAIGSSAAIDLGSTAAANLSNLINNSGWFSVCMVLSNENVANTNKYFNATNISNNNAKPQLIINYTEASNTPPTFNNNGTNNSAPFKNNAVMFYVNWSDDTALSFYRFEWNISGSFDNSSNGTLSGTSFNVTVTKNITANPGIVIAWKFFVNDSNNAWNETPYYFLTVADAPPAYNNNGTNNTAPKINEVVSFYVNLSDDVNVSYYRFEWNITGSFDNNSNGTIGQESFNLTVNKTITAAYGARIAWKVYFNDSSNQWSSTSSYLFTVANTNPVINEVICYNYSNAINCSSIRYRNNLTVIRVNCTDADNQVLNVSYNLTNVNDTSILINSNATANDSALFNYTYNQLINDSGLFNLTVTCYDKATTVSNTTAWYIDFGRLGSVLKIIFNNVEYTTGNVNVRQHDWFKAILNITCANGECGTINASLDPASNEIEVKEEHMLNLLKIVLFALVFVLISLLIFIRIDTKIENKFILISALAVFLFIVSNFTSTITGFATGALVNTTAGAAPFYTNNTNPLTQLNLSCLTSMHDNGNCEAEWYVNATGSIGNISEFYAFVNGTNYSLTNISNNLSITIKSCIIGESCTRAGYIGSTYSSDCVCSGGTQTSSSSSSSSSSGSGGSPPITATKKETTEETKTEEKETIEETAEEEKTEDFFKTIITIEKSEISESELQLKLESIMDKFWKTQKYSKIIQPPEFVYNNETNTTEVTYRIVPLNATLINYSLYLNISKCAALYAGMVAFKEDYNFEVLIDDPLLKLSFDEIKEPITVSYNVRGEILEYCKKLLLALGIAENVFEQPKPKQMALSPPKITYRDIISSFKSTFPGSLFALIPFFIIFATVFAYEEAHAAVEHTKRTKARKIRRLASRAVIDLTLAAIIAGNIAEFSGILSPYLSVLENVSGVVFATYLIYKINIPKLILGIKSRLADISIITAYYLIISNVFLGLKFAEISQFFSVLAAYLTPAVSMLLFLGVVIIAALSLLLAISADIKKPSLMSMLKQDGKPKSILDIAARFFLLSIILLSFSYIAFKPFIEWVSIAVDAPLLMVALCIFVFLALKHHKKITIEKIMEEPIEEEDIFYKKFFEEFEFKRKIVFGVSGLLVLNALVDAFVFLLPNDFYLGSISISGHIPVTAYIIKELPLVSNISRIALPYAYILNMIFIFSVLALPMVILYKLITDKKLIFKRWLAVLFFSSFTAYLLMPVYKIGQLTAEKVIGADIQTRSILYSDFLIRRFIPSQAMALTVVVSLSLLTVLFTYSFYKKWSRLFSMAMVSITAIFFAMHVYYYISSTWFYAMDIGVKLAAETALDRYIGIIKVILLFAATIFYYIIFFIFIGKVFLEYRKEEKLSKEHEKHAKKLAKWISKAHKAGLKPGHTKRLLTRAGWPGHIVHHAHRHAEMLKK